MFKVSFRRADPIQEKLPNVTAPEKEATNRADSQKECAAINMHGKAM